jgi:hypothetical protein
MKFNGNREHWPAGTNNPTAGRCFAVYDTLFKSEFLDGQFLSAEDLIIRHAPVPERLKKAIAF